MATTFIAKEKGKAGRFGPYGGRYVPETLMAALEELEREYAVAKRDGNFRKRLDGLSRQPARRRLCHFLCAGTKR